MKIVICRSNRHSESALRYAKELQGSGLDVYCPERVEGTEAWEKMTEADQQVTLRDLVDKHFRAIDESDAVLIYNEDGYIGTSVSIEIGYAVAKEKRIFSIVPDSDSLRSILFEGLVKRQ